MITAEAIHKSKRVAGNVIRYHTWPTITNQTVADHTYHVMRIYHELFAGDPDFEWDDRNVAHILMHDMGEQKVGDLPYPVKKNDPILAERVAIQEDLALGIQEWPSRGMVPDHQKNAIKICDLLEMAEYAQYEKNLGNRYAHIVYIRVTSHVMNEFQDFWARYPTINRAVVVYIHNMEVRD